MESNQDIIRMNGAESRIIKGTSLQSLLDSQGINPNLVACELNLNVIRRADLKTVVLKDGDVLEVLHMIGGG